MDTTPVTITRALLVRLTIEMEETLARTEAPFTCKLHAHTLRQCRKALGWNVDDVVPTNEVAHALHVIRRT